MWTASIDQANSSSDLSQILILRFNIPISSLHLSSSLPYFTLANWKPSLTQSSSCSSLVSLFCPTLFNHIPLQELDIPNHMASQANQIYYQTVYRSWYLMGQEARYPWKSWVFNSCFSFKVRQHDQQKLYFQYKVCWILYEIVGSPSFSQPYLCKQAALQSPPKNYFLYFSQLLPSFFPLTF